MNITECERRILNVIYELQGKADLQTVVECVNRKYHTEWKVQAVQEFIRRLLHKKYIVKRKTSENIYYDCVFEQTDINIAALWDIRNNSFERDWNKMIAYIRQQQHEEEQRTPSIPF